jgi:lipopolysaccharide transport system permease protein
MPLNLREVAGFHELFFHLTWRNIKVRYKQTVLGVLWAVLQPLFTMIIFTLLFGRLAHMPSNGLPYPLFAYSGILVWTFFSNAVTGSANSLVGSASLITKVYFPRMIVPASYVASALFDFTVAFLLLIPLMIHYGIPFTPRALLAPVMVAVAATLALALGLWLGALNVRYRDVQYTIPFAMQLWMFASPIIYPVELVPAKWRWVLAINPMTGIIENFRWALLGRPELNAVSLAFSAAATVAILVVAAFVFRRLEDVFADMV